MFRKFILSGINRTKNAVENYENSGKLWKYYVPFAPYHKKQIDYETTKKVWFAQLKDVKLTDEDKEELSKRLLNIKMGKIVPEDTTHYVFGKITKIATINYMLADWYNTPEQFIAAICANFIYGVLAFETAEYPSINDILEKHDRRTKEFNEKMELLKIKNSIDDDIKQL